MRGGCDSGGRRDRVCGGEGDDEPGAESHIEFEFEPCDAETRSGPLTPHPLQEVDGTWQRREPALAAVAVVGVGAVAARLAAATHERLRDGAELRAIADPEYLVVLGAAHELPWIEGARYLGWDGRALTLTTHRVRPAADLWRDAAIAEQGGDPAALVVVLPEQILVSEMPERLADPEVLAAAFATTDDARRTGSATVLNMKRAAMSTTTPETLPAR